MVAFLYRASQFSGYKQQDSQELLRYLLDSLRSEEIDVSAYIRTLLLEILCIGTLYEDKPDPRMKLMVF